MMRFVLGIVLLVINGATLSLVKDGAVLSEGYKPLTKEQKTNPKLRLFDTLKQEKLGFLSSTLGSNMVLQRDQETRIWGFTRSGATIVTNFKEYTFLTKADKNGIWRQKLPAQPASLEPTNIAISASTGENAFLSNILFGDVYICGGQSNMQFSIPATTNSTAEALRANDYPHVRLFTVGQGTSSDTPLKDLQTIEQQWSVANSATVSNDNGFGYFSAVCWFFGRTISEGLDNKVPLGLISNNWGGTSVEQWSTNEALYECNRTNEKQGNLYNSMIHPYTIGPMALTGFAWYQGEANVKSRASANDYACLFSAMIKAWRKTFQSAPDAYFGFVQLSTWCLSDPMAIPEMREAQMAALVRVPGKIGYATNADYGAGCDIHPPTKQPCGIRLGNSALALQYNRTDIKWRSPSYISANATMMGIAARVVVDLADVGDNGLLITYPHNHLDGTFNCTAQEPGTCAWASVRLTKEGWVNATVTISEGRRMVLIAAVTQPGQNVIGSAYGWGSVPMLNVYDARTDLPVLPWNRSLSVFARESF
jgi:sialate O-acetylesterase